MSMSLILELVPRDGGSPEGEPRKVFGVEGGRIGRAADCEWVLSSPYISRYHASICCTDGAYYVVSTGENGVALNDALAYLPQLEHRKLEDGDRLFMDEYEIKVEIPAALAAPGPSLRTEFGLRQLDNPVPTAPATQERAEIPWNHSSGLADHFVPPAVPATGLPADWDDIQPARAEPDLLPLLRALGVETGNLTPEMTATLGHLLRGILPGLIQALRTKDPS